MADCLEALARLCVRLTSGGATRTPSRNGAGAELAQLPSRGTPGPVGTVSAAAPLTVTRMNQPLTTNVFL